MKLGQVGSTLRSLLAVIHCDGGHYTERVGLEVSAQDAMTKLCRKANSGDNLSGLRGILETQGQHGNWNCDDYSLGLYNGLELALATLEGRDPVFRTKPAGDGGE